MAVAISWHTRATRIAFAFVACAYALFVWKSLRPPFLKSWRETDTQTIALNMAAPGGSIWYPQIAWGGGGPGYVEAEFQGYTWIVSRFLRFTGDAAWPGQLVSLIAVLAAASVAFVRLSSRYGGWPGLAGAATLLTSAAVLQSATSVQPEALCLALYVTAWFFFLDYAETGDRLRLLAYAGFGAAAMLVKPTAAHLGISSFLLLALSRRALLRTAWPWLAWGGMLALLVLYMLHAREIYLRYGNTFGVLSGGDSKLPAFTHLLMPRLYLDALVNAVKWGTGPIGAAAVVLALVLRQGVAPMVSLLAANVIWTVFALRYTSGWAGTHYHLLGAVMAAQAVALVVKYFAATRLRSWSVAAVMIGGLLWLNRSVAIRRWLLAGDYDVPAVAVAQALAAVAKPGERVVIRSPQPAFDPDWNTVNNFEDPRVFYLSKTRGWVVGSDNLTAAGVARPAELGARFYVETIARPPSVELDRWLDTNARLVASTREGGKVFALASRP